MLVTLLFICVVQVFNAKQAGSLEYPAPISYATCAAAWTQKGCKIGYNNNLTILEDHRYSSSFKIDWNNFPGFKKELLCRCRQKAVSGQYSWFAVDVYGICLAAKGTYENYVKNNPLDDASKCAGDDFVTATSNAPDGSGLCSFGVHRVFLYIVQNLGAAAPEEEEEIVEGPAQAPNKEKEEEIEQCKLAADVVLVIDKSGSVKLPNFQRVKLFIKAFMDRFDFSGKSKIGIVTFDSYCSVDLTWEQSANMSKAQIKEKVDGIKYTGGSTVTDRALKCVKDKVIITKKKAGQTPRTVVVMTDGKSYRGDEFLPVISRVLRDEYGCKMVAIGVSDEIDPIDLNIMTSGKVSNVRDKTNDNTLYYDNYDQMMKNMTVTLNILVGKSCKVG